LIPCSRSENDEWCRRGLQQRATFRIRNPPEIERPDREIPLAESACDARLRSDERRSNMSSQSGNQSSLRALRRSKSRRSFRPLRGKTASAAAFHKWRSSCTLLKASRSLDAKEIRLREHPKRGKQRSEIAFAVICWRPAAQRAHLEAQSPVQLFPRCARRRISN